MDQVRMFERGTVTAAAQNAFIRSVYNWMGAGLVLTAVVALATASSTTMLRLIFGNQFVFFGLIIGELLLVIALGSMINRLSVAAATGMFLVYSALNGVTLSAVLLAYTRTSVASTFLVTAGTFGAMSMYGTMTKKDLTSWGSFLMMGLIGIIIASVVNIFLMSDMMSWVMSVCAVIVFTGLTAYDTQKLRMYGAQAEMGDGRSKMAIMGALALYLDFINLFLALLRLMGRRR